ncbi:MAG: hypothetical protein IJ184_01260 [Alphaproteobacteria bacterium]|nr:hypothetical protein [Alphaproteobacteria bacterium]
MMKFMQICSVSALALGLAQAANATQFGCNDAHPTCIQLGFDQTATDCSGYKAIKCPFNTNALFCDATTHSLQGNYNAAQESIDCAKATCSELGYNDTTNNNGKCITCPFDDNLFFCAGTSNNTPKDCEVGDIVYSDNNCYASLADVPAGLQQLAVVFDTENHLAIDIHQGSNIKWLTETNTEEDYFPYSMQDWFSDALAKLFKSDIIRPSFATTTIETWTDGNGNEYKKDTGDTWTLTKFGDKSDNDTTPPNFPPNYTQGLVIPGTSHSYFLKRRWNAFVDNVLNQKDLCTFKNDGTTDQYDCLNAGGLYYHLTNTSDAEKYRSTSAQVGGYHDTSYLVNNVNGKTLRYKATIPTSNQPHQLKATFYTPAAKYCWDKNDNMPEGKKFWFLPSDGDLLALQKVYQTVNNGLKQAISGTPFMTEKTGYTGNKLWSSTQSHTTDSYWANNGLEAIYQNAVYLPKLGESYEEERWSYKCSYPGQCDEAKASLKKWVIGSALASIDRTNELNVRCAYYYGNDWSEN